MPRKRRPTPALSDQDQSLESLLAQVPGADKPATRITDARIRRWEGQRRHHARLEIAYVYHLGRALRGRKSTLKHGEYLPWLAEVGISQRSAQRYQQISALLDEVLRTRNGRSLPAAEFDGINILGLPDALRAAFPDALTSSAAKHKGWNPPDDVQRHPVQQMDAIEGLKGLADESVDLILTDPPWQVQGAAPEGRTRAHRLCRDRWFDTVPDHYYEPLFRECFRVLRHDSLAYCFAGWDTLPAVREAMETAGFGLGHPLVWHKTGSMGMGHRFRRCSELILIASKGQPRRPKDAVPDVIECHRVSHHRTNISVEKPSELLETLIAQAALRPSSLVVDPFAGTGSTGAAALTLGHRFVGFDIAHGETPKTRDHESPRRASAAASPTNHTSP